MAVRIYPVSTKPNHWGTCISCSSLGCMQSTGQPAGAQLVQHQLSYQHIQQQLQQQLQAFWAKQSQEIEKVTDFKNHSLPLARIKKIMKADEDVRMVLTVFGTKLYL
ncbi:hypothetical protein TSUD_345290 [Trifolium subterraneum]|nr:hypothetical protein TSUD_345290 [Trifolium subterraneum]